MPELELFEETMRESAGHLSLRERGIVVTDSQRAMMIDLVYNGIYEGQRLRRLRAVRGSLPGVAPGGQ